jgi:hypothetical protein
MENDSLPIRIEEFTGVIATAPGILTKNETSVSACNAAGQTLLDTIEATGGITSDELDGEVSDYINKVKVTVSKMNERRKPVTQLLQAVSKRFTSLESAIDLKTSGSVPFRLQKARDQYAAKKLAEQKAREEAARRAQALENEKISYRSDIAALLDAAYTTYVEKHIGALNVMFERITPDNYNQQFKLISESGNSFVWNDFILNNVSDTIVTFHMDADTRKAIKNAVAAEKKKEYAERYAFEIGELKQSLIERLPSKRKALEEEAELRRQDAEAAKIAEQERIARENEERQRQEEERKRQEEAARRKAEAEKATAEAQAAFDFMSAAATEAAPKVKVKKKIEVTNPRGFLEIYQLWMMKEGLSLPMEDLEKAHKKMIAFCEKEANKDGGETIRSAFVKYVDDVKAK